jgi:Flp pilus assembly secretin CpaC
LLCPWWETPEREVSFDTGECEGRRLEAEMFSNNSPLACQIEIAFVEGRVMHAWNLFGSAFRHVAMLVALGLTCSTPCAALPAETLVVQIDHARPVKVPAGAQTLVIGNPMIADVTMLKQGNVMILTGKGFGETNFIALDAAGNPVAESTIRVVAGDGALVVQRGLERQSYSCEPRCQPTVRLGDDAKYFGEVSAQVQAHNTQAATNK